MLGQNGHEGPRWVQFGDRRRGPDSACAGVGAVASICQGDAVSISSYIQKKKALEKIFPLAPKRNISLNIYHHPETHGANLASKPAF